MPAFMSRKVPKLAKTNVKAMSKKDGQDLVCSVVSLWMREHQ